MLDSQQRRLERIDVLVIGAGQAGLAMARALGAANIACRVMERLPRVGDSWRRRFDSLVLFTPRSLSALPGFAMEGEPHGYPTKNEIADYLERYAERFALPVETRNGVARLSMRSARFAAITEAGLEVEARAVVIAAGAFQRARIPPFAAALSSRVQQLDATTYHNPSDVAGPRVVVVGDGATGRQIALELSFARADVTLAMGHRRNFGPQQILGTDTNRWAWRLGLLTAHKSSLRGRLVRALEVTPGLTLREAALRSAGIRLAPRCIDAGATRFTFADGTTREFDAVIYALGYVDDTTWIDVDGATTTSGLAESRGVSPVRGIFYVGREWQTCRASALVCGVHRDAALVAARIARYLSRA